MNMGSNRSRLAALTRELSGNWQQTRESWRDAKSAEFEKKYMDELVASVTRAVSCIERLEAVVTKVRKDCE